MVLCHRRSARRVCAHRGVHDISVHGSTMRAGKRRERERGGGEREGDGVASAAVSCRSRSLPCVYLLIFSRGYVTQIDTFLISSVLPRDLHMSTRPRVEPRRYLLFPLFCCVASQNIKDIHWLTV